MQSLIVTQMTDLIALSLAFSVVTSVIALWLGARIFELRYSPVFWRMAILAGVFVAPLSSLMAIVLPAGVVQHLQVVSVNNEFQLLFQQAAGEINQHPGLTPWSIGVLATAVYFGITALLLLRLVLLRWAVVKAANKATPAVTLSGQRFYICQRQHPPFAIKTRLFFTSHRIVIPQVLIDNVSAHDIETIVTHESAHIVNGDDEQGFLLRMAAAFLWGNPFMLLLISRWVQSTEYWADAAATAERSKEFRHCYANTLLSACRLTATRVWQYPAASFSINHLRNEKMRIGNIMHGPKPKFKRTSHRRKLMAVGGFLSLVAATTLAATTSSAVPQLPWVLKGRLSSDYGLRSHPMKQGKQHHHNGIDVAAPLGTPIHAPAHATVVAATSLYQGKPGYGNVVVLETQGGTQTLFSHLDSYSVQKGQVIAKGVVFAAIGETGKATGPHVHIETFVDGERVDPKTVWPIHIQ